MPGVGDVKVSSTRMGRQEGCQKGPSILSTPLMEMTALFVLLTGV